MFYCVYGQMSEIRLIIIIIYYSIVLKKYIHIIIDLYKIEIFVFVFATL